MSPEITGSLTITKQRFAVLVARVNDFITQKLHDGAVDALRRHGCPDNQITTIRVPGSFEIPFVAQALARTGQFDAIICLGCVIRGQTPHFEYVASQAAKGIAQVGLDTGVPTTFGVITADTLEQAIDRAGAKGGNKGVDAALGAIELANLVEAIGKRGTKP